MPASVPSCSQPLYAVIDLGSNSFHMLITRLVANSVQVVDKVKRKVRLASGLDEQNILNQAAMARGWECLSFFAERLQDIPPENIKIVATATLRLAQNSADFITKAEAILGQKIELISGEQEANHIYLGVAHTTSSADNRLVIDIGGASTELIVGSGFEAKKLCSLDMGCVTFNSEFFSNGELSASAFGQANKKAKDILQPQSAAYKAVGWDCALGVSGTLQAVAEVLSGQGKVQQITLENLLDIQQQVIQCKTLDMLNIQGLEQERIPVFAPGLAILIAIFETFDIEDVQIAGGAIREGILYELLPNMRNVNIRQRTLAGLIERYSIDERHAYRVANIADQAFNDLGDAWQLPNNLASILQSACVLHEIGLLLEYKKNKQHAEYILNNADLAGFSNAERKLLIALVSNYKTEINFVSLAEQSFTTNTLAVQIIAILRLAVILSRRRTDDSLERVEFSGKSGGLTLTLETSFLKKHPLIYDGLKREVEFLAQLKLQLNITTFS